MIDVPVYDMTGKPLGAEQIDEAVLGGSVRMDLLKQAIVAYEGAQRQGTFKTKTRAEVDGSSRKLYRQKGTGNARAGNLRTPVRVGGGHAFAKRPRSFDQILPKRMRRTARNSAILAKLQSGQVLIIDGMKFEQPRTKAFAGMLKAVGVKGTCLVTVEERNESLYRSGRNIPGVDVRPLSDVNAYHVIRPRQLVLSRAAFAALKTDEGGARRKAAGE